MNTVFVFDSFTGKPEVLLHVGDARVINALRDFIRGPLQELATAVGEQEERRGKLPGIVTGKAKTGPKAKQIYVKTVEPESAYAKVIQPGDTFSSARQASTDLGYGYNAVGLGLSGKDEVTLKGITFARVENIDA